MRPKLIRPEGLRRRLLLDAVGEMVADLQKPHGKCWASEAGLRHEFKRRTGYTCGERSIGRVRKVAIARGHWGGERVLPNRVMANGVRTLPGTMHTWVISRYEQRKARRRAAEEERQRRRRAGQERARIERERLEAEQRAREDLAARTVRRQASVGLMTELVAPPKLAELLDPPASAPPEQATFDELAERQRAEVARQLAALERAGLLDKPPDE